jgi:hypothetical protein
MGPVHKRTRSQTATSTTAAKKYDFGLGFRLSMSLSPRNIPLHPKCTSGDSSSVRSRSHLCTGQPCRCRHVGAARPLKLCIHSWLKAFRHYLQDSCTSALRIRGLVAASSTIGCRPRRRLNLFLLGEKRKKGGKQLVRILHT